MMDGIVFKSILVGDDGSPEASRAVDIAFSVSKRYSAKLTLLGVKTPASAESQAEGYGLEEHDQAQSRLKDQLEQSAQAGRASDIQVTVAIVDADEPEKAIEQYAEEHAIDLIVVGHRDVSRIRHWLEKSTSEDLARKSAVSILIVH